tara:strand:- start:3394 stop:4821 length:1428 start_codon:yes stop_codon:yes gene_type:complete
MAYTIEQKPNQLAGANSPMVFVLKEDSPAIYNADKFRYIAQVYISTTDASTWVERAKIKIHKNSADVGIVDVHKIVRSYLETQEKNVGNQEAIAGSIHSIGISDTSNSYSQNTSQVVGVKLVGGYEKASSATAAPEETLTLANTIIYSIPASTPYTDTGTNVGGLDYIITSPSSSNNPLTNYIPSGATKKFLTNAPRVQFVRGSSTAADNVDELTIAFINKGLVTDGDALVKMAIEYYNSAGGQIGSTKYFTNDTGSGGKATADDVKNSLLYFGCGTANLENQVDEPDNQPSEFADWAYYVIYGADGSGNQETDKYYFYRYGATRTGVDDRHQSCTRYDNVRLAWRNRLGAWDYMNFRGKSTESVDITRSDAGSVPGTWDSATFTYNNWDRGKKTLYTEATRKLTINSDWLNPDEGVWLEELFTSTNVQILADDNVVYPVVITDKKYTKKTSVNNKIKIQYTVNLEYANKVRTNS